MNVGLTPGHSYRFEVRATDRAGNVGAWVAGPTIRAALTQLQPGQVSDPVALDKGFGVLKLERKVEGSSVPFDDVKGELAQQVRRRVERIAMQRLGRTILSESEVVILDPALQKSFNEQKKQVLRGE